jgi:hypothetical protein
VKTIGSKQAEELARVSFGKGAYVSRSGGSFHVGVFKWNLGAYYVKHVLGTGRSWAEALTRSGVEVPDRIVVPIGTDMTPPTKPLFVVGDKITSRAEALATLDAMTAIGPRGGK